MTVQRGGQFIDVDSEERVTGQMWSKRLAKKDGSPVSVQRCVQGHLQCGVYTIVIQTSQFNRRDLLPHLV